MGLYTQTIGKDFPHGFAGSYAYQPDMIVKTRPVGGAAVLSFGTPVKYEVGTNGNVVAMGDGDTGDAFVGFASREIKSSVNYLEQGGAHTPLTRPSACSCGGLSMSRCRRALRLSAARSMCG